MNGADLWKSILTFTLGSGILITVLGFIARSAFLHFLSHDLETHKAKLAADNALALEQFKAQLRAAAFERERLHEERLRLIAALYEKLATAYSDFQGFLAPLQFGGREDHRKRVQAAIGKAADFFEYFEGRRIFFDTELCRLIDELQEAFRRASAEMTPLFTSNEPLGKTWNDAWKEFTDTVPPLRREIEKRARRILGVTEPAATQTGIEKKSA
jgi:hypothetical protein